MTKELNAVQQLWLNRLRDPNAKQAQRAMRVTSVATGELVGHCCLGEYYAAKYGDRAFNKFVAQDGQQRWTADGNTCILPDWDLKSLGINIDDCGTLADLNDTVDATFLQIADVLEDVFTGKYSTVSEAADAQGVR